MTLVEGRRCRNATANSQAFSAIQLHDLVVFENLKCNDFEKNGGALSGPVLHDTARLSQRYPLLRAMGFLVSQHDQLGAIPLPFFLSLFPFGEHAKWRCDTPPPQKGYLSDTCAIPYENKAQRLRYPLLRYYLERVFRDMGGYLALSR